MYNSKIIGLGKYLPDNVVTNADLEKIMETSDAWIQERTGIQERRHIAKDSDDSTSSMGVKASKIAIERAGLLPQDIDLILFATLSPDYYFPGSGVLVQEALEIPDCPAMDIRMQCSGFVYAVATADQFIKTGMYKNVLVIGSEYTNAIDLVIKSHGHYPKEVKVVTPHECEFVKYFSNSFKAYKTVFANSFGKLCDKHNVDYSKVLEVYKAEEVKETAYLKYFDEGFGGMCLPKDVNAINKLTEGTNISTFDFILNENKKFF